MSRRSTPRQTIDERAFPVRVLLHGAEDGFLIAFGRDRDPYDWIRLNPGLGNAVLYPWRSPDGRRGHQFLCRTPEVAVQFLAAFPELTLADGTASEFYNSPYVFAGRRRHQ